MKVVPATVIDKKAETVREIDPNKPMVALTFDDGPSARYTPVILDILEANNAVATFFVLGTEAAENTELLTRILDGGNEIGNHSFDHGSFIGLPDWALHYQLDATQQVVREATGYTPVLVRPPYGFINDKVLEEVPMPIILWSIDTLDWENKNPTTIYNNIFNDLKDGDIILMHDTFASSVEAARTVIPELIRRGYQLVTISELAEQRGVSLEPGTVYKNFHL